MMQEQGFPENNSHSMQIKLIKIAMPEEAACVDIQSKYAFLVPHSTYLMSHLPTSQESSIRYPKP